MLDLYTSNFKNQVNVIDNNSNKNIEMTLNPLAKQGFKQIL
jgi:hypothetical protein